MIPKIIHQTWKNTTIPEEFAGYQKKLIELHPDWEYRLWTDEQNLEFVKQNFADFYEVFIRLPKNIMRADVIRYLIMYKIGGLYLDLDYEMIKPFDLLNFDLVLPYNRQIKYGDRYDGIGNCIFASAPGHKFWEYIIDDLKNTKDYEAKFKSLSGKPYVPKNTTLEEAITGPAFVTKIFYSVKDELQNYTLPDREAFHPPYNTNYNTILTSKASYGIHHCHGTWRSKSYIKKMGKLIKSILPGVRTSVLNPQV